MSRRKVRFGLAALLVAGGLVLGAPNAHAAGRAAQEPGLWSLALAWVTHLWEENAAGAGEAQGRQLAPDEPHGMAPPEGTASDQGWMVDPNG
jgi:hypothetical protein